MDRDQIAQEIITVCQELHQQRLLSGADGNISYRIDDGEIVITPAGRSKRLLQIRELAGVDINGKVLCCTPSSELLMHLTIYKRAGAARCVIHAHPPTAIGWTIARPDLKELPNDCTSEMIVALGRVPIVPYTLPASAALAAAVAPYIPDHRALILARHGALCWGESLEEALNGMERIEHAALILKSAEELGGRQPLETSELDELWKLRKRIGTRLL